MKTKQVLIHEDSPKHLINLRCMTEEEWINQYASGTLRKNKRIGMAWKTQYLEERTAWEFGWGFQCLPRSRVTFGDAITESDCHALTEAGWFIDRYIARSPFLEDKFECKYIRVEYCNNLIKQGVGIVVNLTSASFIPEGYLVFALVAKEKNGKWKRAKNPF